MLMLPRKGSWALVAHYIVPCQQLLGYLSPLSLKTGGGGGGGGGLRVKHIPGKKKRNGKGELWFWNSLKEETQRS